MDRRVTVSSDISTRNCEEFEQNNFLKITANGKLKWYGDFESLQLFIEKKLVDSSGEWSTPRGGCKEFKHSQFNLRWYDKTKSIILEGKQDYSIKHELLSFAQKEEELSEDTENSDDESNTLGNIDDHNGDEANVGQRANLLEETVEMLVDKVATMDSNFKANNEQVNNIISDLASKVSSLLESRPHERANNPSIIERVENENFALKKENEFLRERIEVLTYTLSNLNNRIKSAEQEKQSLQTVIQLISCENAKAKSHDTTQQTDNTENSPARNNKEYQTMRNKRKPSTKKTSTTDTTSLINTNQYSLLSVQ